jgi:hypothetical protein
MYWEVYEKTNAFTDNGGLVLFSKRKRKGEDGRRKNVTQRIDPVAHGNGHDRTQRPRACQQVSGGALKRLKSN